MSDIITFSIVALMLVISPGPNGVLIVKTASASGRVPALINILGLVSATFIHGALSILGLSALLVQSAEIYTVIKVLGAAYLFYIGIKAIMQSFKSRKPTPKSHQEEETAHSPLLKRQHSFFIEGFLTQILNPKVSIFYLAAFPQFITFSEQYHLVAFSMVAIHASIIATWFMGVTFVINKIKNQAQDGPWGKWLQRGSGACMIYFSSLIFTH